MSGALLPLPSSLHHPVLKYIDNFIHSDEIFNNYRSCRLYKYENV
jgi:hypothetical protein